MTEQKKGKKEQPQVECNILYIFEKAMYNPADSSTAPVRYTKKLRSFVASTGTGRMNGLNPA